MVYKVMVVLKAQDFPTLLLFRFRRLLLPQYQLDRQSLEQVLLYHHLVTATLRVTEQLRPAEIFRSLWQAQSQHSL